MEPKAETQTGSPDKLTWVSHVMAFIPPLSQQQWRHTHKQEDWHACEHTLYLTYFLTYISPLSSSSDSTNEN